MVSSEVQRTLVKSPPELWAELGDPASLARHLGELGEIRITRVEPETTVEWAGEKIAGTVSIKPSGWGTKVTLTVSREAAVEEAAAEEAAAEEAAEEATAEAPPGSETVVSSTDRAEPEAQAALEPVVELEPQIEAASTVEPEIEREPRRGFFARVFGRRRRAKPASELPSAPEREPPRPDPFVAVRAALASEDFRSAHLFAAPPPSPRAIERAEAISAELKAAEEVAADDVSAEVLTAVLTAVLDRLGAAHHRPFSRA
jgi:hypothetical protein